MNPHNPTHTEMRHTEELFFQQMKRVSQKTNHPRLAASGWLQTFDLQFSDRWIGEVTL